MADDGTNGGKRPPARFQVRECRDYSDCRVTLELAQDIAQLKAHRLHELNHRCELQARLEEMERAILDSIGAVAGEVAHISQVIHELKTNA